MGHLLRRPAPDPFMILPCRDILLAGHGGADTRVDGDGKDVCAGHLGDGNLQSAAGKHTQFGGLRKDARSDLPQTFPAFAEAGSIKEITKFYDPRASSIMDRQKSSACFFANAHGRTISATEGDRHHSCFSRNSPRGGATARRRSTPC